VLARVASSDYFDERRAGQVDMTEALRSPGSALKPFIYGLAFEDGVAHPETMIEDRPVRYGAYAPENFDMTFQGSVTARRALQLSLNVPAVALLDGIGASRLSARISQAGASLVLPKGEAPGLAMALGGLGIKLSDLTMLYAGIARGGEALPLVERLGPGGSTNPPAVIPGRAPARTRNPAPQGLSPELDSGFAPSARPGMTPGPRRLLDPVAAWYVGNVLAGTPPPENAAGGRIAYKTGTSYGFRDAWSVGFDGKRTIGVWVGRPDGAPMPGLMGVDVAVPILADTFVRAGGVTRLPAPPPGLLAATSSQLPPPLRRLRGSRATVVERDTGPSITYPPSGARIDLGAAGGSGQPLVLKLRNGKGPFTWFADGEPIGREPWSREWQWVPRGAGFVTLGVVDAEGRADRVTVFVE
jgi:penicillin-binding protein 1C